MQAIESLDNPPVYASSLSAEARKFGSMKLDHLIHPTALQAGGEAFAL
ncbi:hypothetical protein [Aromatoleum buckelii]|uniref:Uncharacterized protein n=1 Tax=Aromatoleum buckelii TaxID=200254 RepID=A0ABX1N352_9RHOO|nr:hypothetical protein [Aromatoleum buckelii]MCK0513174.1 hypothetical protein [Aromatoleum buckelii]